MYISLRDFLSAYQSALIFCCSGSTGVKGTAKYEIRVVTFLLTFKISFIRADVKVYENFFNRIHPVVLYQYNTLIVRL